MGERRQAEYNFTRDGQMDMQEGMHASVVGTDDVLCHSANLCYSANELLKHPGVPKSISVGVTLEDLSCLDVSVLPSEQIDIDIECVARGHTVLVTGVISTKWHGSCRRCLADVGGDLSLEISEMYQKNPEDELIYPIANGMIDLEPLVRDAIVTELPLTPLCSSDCRGICPDCGADLNQEKCSCNPSVDPRWKALDNLKTERYYFV